MLLFRPYRFARVHLPRRFYEKKCYQNSDSRGYARGRFISLVAESRRADVLTSKLTREKWQSRGLRREIFQYSRHETPEEEIVSPIIPRWIFGCGYGGKLTIQR